MTDFDREVLEKIPPDDLREIVDSVKTKVDNLFDDADKLGMPRSTYCSECHPAERRLQYVVSSVLTGECWCRKHYFEKRLDEACKEYLESHKPKKPFPVAELKYGSLVPLDVDDFARI